MPPHWSSRQACQERTPTPSADMKGPCREGDQPGPGHAGHPALWPSPLTATALPRVPEAPPPLQCQHPYPRTRKSWLARRPRGPGRPTLPRRALGAHQARVAFVAWDSRVPRLAVPTRRSFVTFDPGISLEEERSVSASKGQKGPLSCRVPVLCLPEPCRGDLSPGRRGHLPRSPRGLQGTRRGL